VIGGSTDALVNAIRSGADLRIYTEFLHNEHIDVSSPSAERIREVAEFAVTYLVQDRWAAGIMSLRQPVSLPDGFGPRSSMSFFLYNQDGQQAIARLYLDGPPVNGPRGESPSDGHSEMSKYHALDGWDAETNAPSSNFVYDFDVYRFFVRDNWEEVLSHDADGTVRSGSMEALATAFSDGCAVKIGIAGLCAGLAGQRKPEHEVFVEVGSCYYYTGRRSSGGTDPTVSHAPEARTTASFSPVTQTEGPLFIGGSHPVVRVQPDIPMCYRSGGWDFGWLVARTDGTVVYRRGDPYSLGFDDVESAHAIRWFVRR
jgi:hypothetical protein